MVDFLFILIKLSSYAICYGSGVWAYKAKYIELGCFCRGSTFCIEISHGQGRPPSTILGNRKLETLGYPTVKTASLYVLSF